MSKKLKERMAEAIYEIFVNAQIHSETEHICTCGQFYPNKDMIEFTIVDAGIGFKEKVNRRFKSNLSSTQAIQWATKDKHTTEVGVTGGIGLALLNEFIEKNRGKVQIVSDNGFYQFDRQGELLQEFNGSFPGTIVNLQFNTRDRSSYLLKSELSVDNVF